MKNFSPRRLASAVVANTVVANVVVILGLVSVPLRAQATIVVPKTFELQEGASFTSLPFGRSTAIRVQQSYGASLFTARTFDITRIAFRPDASVALAAKGVDLELAMGTLPQQAGLAASFAANRGQDFVTVFARRIVSLPAIASAPGPRPFAIDFVLDRSFRYDASQADLVVEVVVHSQQAGRYEMDLDASCTSARTDFGARGCAGSTQVVPVADCPTAALVPGQAFTLRLSGLRPQDWALAFLGTTEVGKWQGLNLPAALDAFGAPGCTLNTDVTVGVAGQASGQGELRLPGIVPDDARLVGAWLRFQGLALDAGANALGMSFSNGHKVQVCGLPPMARVVATSLQATSGTVEAGLVPVTRFSY